MLGDAQAWRSQLLLVLSIVAASAVSLPIRPCSADCRPRRFGSVLIAPLIDCVIKDKRLGLIPDPDCTTPAAPSIPLLTLLHQSLRHTQGVHLPTRIYHPDLAAYPALLIPTTYVTTMRLSVGLAPLVFAYFSVAPALAKTTNCRKCETTITLGDYVDASDLDGLKKHIESVVTGGDGMTWILGWTKATGWEGSASFKRLCGNDKSVDFTWNMDYFKDGKGQPLNTSVKLKGDCGKAVRCRGNTQCEKSGIM